MKKISLFLFLALLATGCSQSEKSFEDLKKDGLTAFAKQDYVTARLNLFRAVQQRPSDPELLYFLGVAYQKQYVLDSALMYLRRADLLSPDNRETNIAIYEVAGELNEWENVLKAIGVLIRTGDPIDNYYEQLVELNIRIGNNITAFHYLKTMLEKTPDNPSVYLMMGNVAAQLDSVEVALEVMDKGLAKFPDRTEFLMNKGIYLASKQEYGKAETIFREIVAKDPKAIPTRLNLANVLSLQKNRDKKREAYELYKQLKTEAPDVPQIDSSLQALGVELGMK